VALVFQQDAFVMTDVEMMLAKTWNFVEVRRKEIGRGD
jgi:hypothetical protein